MIPLLELTSLGKTYATGHGPSVIVKDFNLRVSEGEFVCIVGHSGCGKSTVLSIAMGLNDATVEGLTCHDIPAFSVQYHHEAAPGPHDSSHLFERFRKLMAGA